MTVSSSKSNSRTPENQKNPQKDTALPSITKLRAIPKPILLAPATWMWMFVVVLIVPNVALVFTESYPVVVKIANVVMPLGLYMLIASASKNLGRTMLLCIPLMVLCAFQIVLLYLYGESIIAIDMFMNVMTTNFGEATELLGNLMVAILVVIALYLPMLIYGVVGVVKHLRVNRRALRLCRKAGLCTFGIGIVLSLCCSLFIDGFAGTRQLFPYNVISNLVVSLQRANESEHYKETSRDFTYGATTQRPDSLRQIYVMVIGETSRADSWSLYGYGRETNPRLKAVTGLKSYPYALSEINTTHKSVPMLMSYLTSENFGSEVAHTRSLFEAFNSLGFATAFISNQHRNHSYIDYYGQEAKSVHFLTDSHGPGYDSDLVAALREYLNSTTAIRIFVVLHCYGSHFEYNKRYDSADRRFTPDANATADEENRAQLLNAYDNTILATDHMLADIISLLSKLNCISSMVYTSDHGEDIFDDNRGRFLHASPVPTYWQLHVPFIVWTSPQFARTYPTIEHALIDNTQSQVSSTASMFPTLMQIAGIESKYVKPSESLASTSYCEPKRRYLNDYNESVSYSKAGLKEQDFEMFRKKNLSVE